MKLSNLLPHLALLFSMFVWSSTFVGLKIALSAYSPVEAMTGRMLAAAVVCLPLLPNIIRSFRDRNSRQIMLVSGICMPCLYFLFESNALRFTSSAQAGMVMALQPLAVAVAARIFLGESMPKLAWAGFAIALTGVIWISLDAIATQSAPSPILGNGLELLAVLCATGYTLCIRRLTGKVSHLTQTGAMVFIGTIFFFTLNILPIETETITLENNFPSWLPLASIIYLGIVPTFAGYGLYSYGVMKLSAAKAASYNNCIPVMTLFMGVLMLDEHITTEQYIAILLVISGIILSQIKK